MKIFLRPAAGGRSSVDLGERIGGGGAGDVYRALGRPGEVVKIYRTDDIRRAYAKKVEAMLATPPGSSQTYLADPPLSPPLRFHSESPASFPLNDPLNALLQNVRVCRF